MRILVLGGYGEMGRIAAIDLSETFGGTIVVAGRNAERARQFAASFRSRKVEWAVADADRSGELAGALKGSDVVINATQYGTNVGVMRACLKAGANYVDLGGLFHTTKRQLKLGSSFRKKGLLAIVGCGATPGTTNVMAAHAARSLDSIDTILVRFAGRDFTRYSTPFTVPYSMRTIFDEFSMRPAVFSGGKLGFAEPMSGHEKTAFPRPVGRVTCFYTLHSEVATFPSSFRDKGIRNCDFKGGFDKDFVGKVRFLINAGFSSTTPVAYGKTMKVVPLDFTVGLLNRFMPGRGVRINDVEFLKVELLGKRGGRRKKVAAYCRALTNKKWNIPAGSWDTGVPPSVMAQMIAERRVDASGVLPPELCIDPPEFFARLGRRNIRVSMRTLPA